MARIVEAAIAIAVAKAIEAVLGGGTLSFSVSVSYSLGLSLGLAGGETDRDEAKSGDCLWRSFDQMRKVFHKGEA